MVMGRVNLYDITQEPTDQDLAELMACVRQKVIMTQQKAALKLQADLQQESRKARELHGQLR